MRCLTREEFIIGIRPQKTLTFTEGKMTLKIVIPHTRIPPPPSSV